MAYTQYLPNDAHLEKVVLNQMIRSAMHDYQAFITAQSLIKTDTVFYENKNRLIFNALLDLKKSKVQIDLLSIKSVLQSKQEFMKIGDQYLAEVMQSEIQSVTLERNAKMIVELYTQRELILHNFKINDDLTRKIITPSEAIVKSQSKFSELTSLQKGRLQHWKEFAEECLFENLQRKLSAINSGGTALGDVYSGFVDLDRITGGFNRKDLVILAARPSVGKTALACNITKNIINSGNVLFFSLEQSKDQLQQRICFDQANISMHDIKCGRLSETDARNFIKVSQQLIEKPLYIDDETRFIDDLVIEAERAKYHHESIELIVIDYLQIIKSKDRDYRKNRNLEIADFTSELKALAKAVNCPVLLLSQRNRNNSHETDPLTTLRDSGAIEQDADMVIFLDREEDQKQESDIYNINFSVIKNRNGRTGKCTLQFVRKYMRFQNSENNEVDEFWRNVS